MELDLNAIKELADAKRQHTITATRSKQTTPTAAVAAVALKAQQFWTTNATTWFLCLEAAFATHTPPITNDTTSFDHVIQLLD